MNGSTEISRTDLGFLGILATAVALFLGIGAIVALLQAQWAAFGICVLLCGIVLPNFAKRRRAAGAPSGDFIPQGVAKVVDVSTSSVSLADELTKLVALRNQGVLTDEEFATLKAQFLSRWDRGVDR